jgi:hypothetical protein
MIGGQLFEKVESVTIYPKQLFMLFNLTLKNCCAVKPGKGGEVVKRVLQFQIVSLEYNTRHHLAGITTFIGIFRHL